MVIKILFFELDFILQTVGAIGVVVFYIVLARLSARMGNGFKLPPYYLWYYVSCIIMELTIPVYVSLRQTPELRTLYFSMLLISNVIAIIVSYRYWWWLKDELLGKQEQGR